MLAEPELANFSSPPSDIVLEQTEGQEQEIRDENIKMESLDEEKPAAEFEDLLKNQEEQFQEQEKLRKEKIRAVLCGREAILYQTNTTKEYLVQQYL